MSPSVTRRGRACSSLLLLVVFLASAGCHEEGQIAVKRFTIKGTKAVSVKRLKAVLATKTGSWLPWGEKRYFVREQYEADLKRIQAFYADRGYPEARVASTDVDVSPDGHSVGITVVVEEGPPVTVAVMEFAGFDALTPKEIESLRRRVPLVVGKPRDRQAVQVAKELAAAELKERGYPYAVVDVREALSDDSRHATLTFTGTPGKLAHFGPVDIGGNSSVSENVIRRQLSYAPGELFRLTRIQQSQRKLYSMELFQFASIQPVTAEGQTIGVENQIPSPEQSSEIPTRVTVAEGKHRRMRFGLGYGTEEKVRAETQWRHLNFLGGARQAGVQAKWSSLEQGVKLDFTEPYFFRPNLVFSLSGQQWWSNEPAYELVTSGGRATFVRQIVHPAVGGAGQILHAISMSLIHEFEDYAISNDALKDLSFRDELIALGLDPRNGRGTGTLGAIAFDAQRNTTANLLDASRGYVVSAHFEQAGRWLPGDFDYQELSVEGRHYFTIAGRAVLANRLRFGAIDGRGEETSSVPFFKRYFLGGASSLRGWGRFEVSPLSGSGLPIGGHTMLEASTELRVPVFGNLGAVLFLDAGNVWAQPWRVHVDDLKYDIGPGFRYKTPVGPIRFDLGYQLKPIEGLLVQGVPQGRRYRLHFSIGQAF